MTNSNSPSNSTGISTSATTAIADSPLLFTLETSWAHIDDQGRFTGPPCPEPGYNDPYDWEERQVWKYVGEFTAMGYYYYLENKIPAFQPPKCIDDDEGEDEEEVEDPADPTNWSWPEVTEPDYIEQDEPQPSVTSVPLCHAVEDEPALVPQLSEHAPGLGYLLGFVAGFAFGFGVMIALFTVASGVQ